MLFDLKILKLREIQVLFIGFRADLGYVGTAGSQDANVGDLKNQAASRSADLDP